MRWFHSWIRAAKRASLSFIGALRGRPDFDGGGESIRESLPFFNVDSQQGKSCGGHAGNALRLGEGLRFDALQLFGDFACEARDRTEIEIGRNAAPFPFLHFFRILDLAVDVALVFDSI